MFQSEFELLEVEKNVHDGEFEYMSLLFVSSKLSAVHCFHNCGPYVNSTTLTASRAFDTLRNRLIDVRVGRQKGWWNPRESINFEEYVELHVAMPCDIARHGHNWLFLHEDTNLTLKELLQQQFFGTQGGMQLLEVAQETHTQLLTLIKSWSQTHQHFLPSAEISVCPHRPRGVSNRYPLLCGAIVSLEDIGVFHPATQIRASSDGLLRFFLRNTAVGLVAGNTIDILECPEETQRKLSASLFVSPQLLHASRSETWQLTDPSDDVWTAGIVTLHVLVAAFLKEANDLPFGDDAVVCVLMNFQCMQDHADFCMRPLKDAIRDLHRAIGTICRLVLGSLALTSHRLCHAAAGSQQRFCRFLIESAGKHEELREFYSNLFGSTLCISPSCSRVDKWELVSALPKNLLSRSSSPSLLDVGVSRFGALYNLWKANRERTAMTQNGSMNSLITKHSAVFVAVLELTWDLWLDFPHLPDKGDEWQSLVALHLKDKLSSFVSFVTCAGLLESYLPVRHLSSSANLVVSTEVLVAAMKRQGLLPKGVGEIDALVSPVALCSTSSCAPQPNGSVLDGVLGATSRRANIYQHKVSPTPPQTTSLEEYVRFCDSLTERGRNSDDIDAQSIVRDCRNELIRHELGAPSERRSAELRILDLLQTSMKAVGQRRHKGSIPICPSFLPAVLRGELWWTMLLFWDESSTSIPRTRCELKIHFERIDTDAPNCNDRQIAVDIPRCHQYDASLCSSEGHSRLMRVVKAWLSTNPTMVYWQGIDSCCYFAIGDV